MTPTYGKAWSRAQKREANILLLGGCWKSPTGQSRIVEGSNYYCEWVNGSMVAALSYVFTDTNVVGISGYGVVPQYFTIERYLEHNLSMARELIPNGGSWHTGVDPSFASIIIEPLKSVFSNVQHSVSDTASGIQVIKITGDA